MGPISSAYTLCSLANGQRIPQVPHALATLLAVFLKCYKLFAALNAVITVTGEYEDNLHIYSLRRDSHYQRRAKQKWIYMKLLPLYIQRIRRMKVKYCTEFDFFESGRGRIWPDLGFQIRPGPGLEPNVLELEA